MFGKLHVVQAAQKSSCRETTRIHGVQVTCGERVERITCRWIIQDVFHCKIILQVVDDTGKFCSPEKLRHSRLCCWFDGSARSAGARNSFFGGRIFLIQPITSQALNMCCFFSKSVDKPWIHKSAMLQWPQQNKRLKLARSGMCRIVCC